MTYPVLMKVMLERRQARHVYSSSVSHSAKVGLEQHENHEIRHAAPTEL
jgi:hypothetical protein